MQTFVVIDIDFITNSMIDESKNLATTFRRSKDSTQAILKFDTRFPESMQGFKKYTQEEILNYLSANSAQWEQL